MAEWYKRPPRELYTRVCFQVGSSQSFKIGIHSIPAGRSALKGQCKEQAGKFTCCAVGKGT